MKKILLIVVGLLAVNLLVAEPAERQKVLLEIGTGTWCPFCPGASMGAQDMIDNGHDVAIIKYHVGDGFANAHSNARANYYGFSGYPTSVFDGLLFHSGGNANNSIYGTFLPLYNQRINVPSPFVLDISLEHIDGLDYEATVLVTNVSEFDAGNLRLHLAVTETDIPFSWFNQTHVKDVLRMMVPNQLGTPIAFFHDPYDLSVETEGYEEGEAYFSWSADEFTETIEIVQSFSLQSSWVQQNMSLVAFLQDVPTKEVFQADFVRMSQGKAEGGNAAAVANKSMPVFNIFLNGDLIQGDVDEMNYLFTELPSGTHELGVQAVYEHGLSDIVSINVTIQEDEPETFAVTFNIMDEDGQPITDASITFDGTEYDSGHYTFDELAEGTYSYLVQYDGYWDVSGEVEVHEDITVDVTMVVDDTFVADPEPLKVTIYPNPTQDILNIDLYNYAHNGSINIYNINGVLLQTHDLKSSESQFDISGLAEGIYLLEIISGNTKLFERFTKIK